MRAQEEHVREVGHADEVGVGGAGLQHVDEAEGAVDLDEAREAHHGVHPDVELQKVQREEAQGVGVQQAGLDVAAGQLLGVVHHQPLGRQTQQIGIRNNR